MIKTTIMVVTLATTGLFTVVSDFQSALPQPVEVCQEDPRLTEVRQALVILGRDPKYAKDIFVSATAKNINPILWVANVECESEFKITAKSKKGYKGLAQTPSAKMKTGYELGDLTYGACTFDEKMKIAKGDVTLAMALYKGGNNPAARKCAAKVFAVYDKLKLQLKEQA